MTIGLRDDSCVAGCPASDSDETAEAPDRRGGRARLQLPDLRAAVDRRHVEVPRLRHPADHRRRASGEPRTLIGFGPSWACSSAAWSTSVRSSRACMDPTAADGFDPADGVASAGRERGTPAAVPVATAIPVAAAAQSALRQIAILDARIADDAAALSRSAVQGTRQRHRPRAAFALGATSRSAPTYVAAPRDLAGRRAAGRGPRRASTRRSPRRRTRPSRIDLQQEGVRGVGQVHAHDPQEGLPELDAASRTLAAVAEVELARRSTSARSTRTRDRGAGASARVAGQLHVRLAADGDPASRRVGRRCEPSQ